MRKVSSTGAPPAYSSRLLQIYELGTANIELLIEFFRLIQTRAEQCAPNRKVDTCCNCHQRFEPVVVIDLEALRDFVLKSKYPPAEPEALRLLAPQRGLIATGEKQKQPQEQQGC
jgi:hypothetical protein